MGPAPTVECVPFILQVTPRETLGRLPGALASKLLESTCSEAFLPIAWLDNVRQAWRKRRQ
jgi:hypothetical protein